jgi:putative glycosyltransferase (TIGR04372 family)
LDTKYTDKDWSYHDYRDSSIQDYLAAAESLTQRGYHTIRMGDTVRETLNVDSPRIIDYPFKRRSAFMDVYLLAKCRFLLASTSGVAGISQIFRVPLAVVNAIPLEYNPAGAQDIYILKKLWLRRENRLMTFREILDSGASRFHHSEEYQGLGIELVDNSPDEITALAIEMDERLNDTWDITQEDEYLQQSYWSLFNPSHLCYNSASRIGADFLRRNRDLLN